MINAATARNYAYTHVGVKCNADAMANLYDAIDQLIEKTAKEGKMSISFSMKIMAKAYLKVQLSTEQLNTLSERVKTDYKIRGFVVDLVTYSYSRDDIDVHVGWFSL